MDTAGQPATDREGQRVLRARRSILAWALAVAAAGVGCGATAPDREAVTARIAIVGGPRGRAPLWVQVDGSGSSCFHGCAWEWEFGDGTRATGARVSHVYGGPGVYALTLTVTDRRLGLEGRAWVQVVAEEPAVADPPAPPSPPPPVLPPPPEPPPPPPDECAGLVPAPGEPVTYEVEKSPTPLCHHAITDGQGRWIGVGIGLKWTGYRFVPASGAGGPVGSLNVPLQGNPPGIAPQPSGYHVTTAGTGAGVFQIFDERGSLVSEGGTQGRPWAIVADPNGGSAMHSWDLENPRPGGGSWGDRLELVGADGELRASILLDRAPGSLIVSRSGNVLLFAGREARWFDREARPLTDWFPVPVGDGTGWPLAGPARLADGRIAQRDSERWLAVISDGRAEVWAAPEWLASRPLNVAVVRGGRANAFVSSGSSPSPCEPRIELVAPSGTSCGTVALPVADACPRVDVGTDGTVFTESELDHGARCVWRWWSGLLR